MSKTTATKRLLIEMILSSRGLLRSVLCVLPLLAALLMSVQAVAHHSQAHFDREYTEIEGVLTEVKMRNPHVLFTLQTEDPLTGEESEVLLETTSLYYLDRAGVEPDWFQEGDRVRVVGRASTRRPTEFLASEMILQDQGQRHVYLLGDEVESRFSENIVDTAAENRGLFRTWSIPRNNERQRHTLLTETAQAALESWDPVNNYSTQCDPGGMPRLMWFPHPFELIDQGDEILAKFEMYNVERTIHMNHSEAPEGTERTRWGYSTGEWVDQRTLVVTTTHIGWPYYQGGIPLSDQVVVTERFALSDDQSRIDLLVTTTDPLNFVEPATVDAYWVALNEELKDFICETD